MFAAVSNQLGEFEIAGVPEGDYGLTVRRSGFTSTEYGQRRSQQEGRTLRVRSDAPIENLDVRLSRGGVLSGRIMDAGGDPLQGVIVRAWERVYGAGRYVMQPMNTVRPQRTDDRGYYRIHGLLPGSY